MENSPVDPNTSNASQASYLDYLCIPFVWLYLVFDMILTPVKLLYFYSQDLLDYVYLPYFQPKAIFLLRCPFGLVNIRQTNYKYWLVALLLCYTNFYQFTLGWYFQRSINYVRESCYCDLMKVSHASPLIEGTWFLFFGGHRVAQFKYFFRKFVCSFFKLL